MSAERPERVLAPIGEREAYCRVLRRTSPSRMKAWIRTGPLAQGGDACAPHA